MNAAALVAAMTFHKAFTQVYERQMTTAALMGGEWPLTVMNNARDALMQKMGCSKRHASMMIRAYQIQLCRNLGHAVPAEYETKLIEVFEAEIL